MERDGRETVFRAEDKQTPTFEISSFSEAASSTQAAELKTFWQKTQMWTVRAKSILQRETNRKKVSIWVGNTFLAFLSSLHVTEVASETKLKDIDRSSFATKSKPFFPFSHIILNQSVYRYMLTFEKYVFAQVSLWEVLPGACGSSWVMKVIHGRNVYL